MSEEPDLFADFESAAEIFTDLSIASVARMACGGCSQW